MSCLEDGVDTPLSSSDEDKTEAEVKTAAPAAGPVSYPCGMIRAYILSSW